MEFPGVNQWTLYSAWISKTRSSEPLLLSIKLIRGISKLQPQRRQDICTWLVINRMRCWCEINSVYLMALVLQDMKHRSLLDPLFLVLVNAMLDLLPVNVKYMPLLDLWNEILEWKVFICSRYSCAIEVPRNGWISWFSGCRYKKALTFNMLVWIGCKYVIPGWMTPKSRLTKWMWMTKYLWKYTIYWLLNK